jgi:hypothetical protein
MHAAAVALLLVSAVLLSACIQETSDALDDTPSGDAATIKGAVVSDEIFPVVGANVSIEGGPSTMTEEGGRFAFEGIEPGQYRLSVAADGYEPATQEVSASPGEVVEVLLTVLGLAGESPYASTIVFEGFAACTFSAVYSAGSTSAYGVPCPFGETLIGTVVNVSDGWRAGVHEVAWESDEEMIAASSLTDGCQTGGPDGPDPCPYLGWGPSPLRIFARPNDAEYAAKFAIDGEATWPEGTHDSHVFTSYSGFFRSEVNQTAYPVCVVINNQFNVPEHWGCPFGIGYSTGLRFTIYHTTFYHDEPLELERFTAIPDQ